MANPNPEPPDIFVQGINLGTIPLGVATAFNMTAFNLGDVSGTITSITFDDADISYTGTLPKTILPIPPGTAVLACSITPSAVGAVSALMTYVVTHDGTRKASITATVVDGSTTTGAQAIPHISTDQLGVFPLTEIFDTSLCVTDLKNVGNADFNLTAITLTNDAGGAITIDSMTALPVTLHPGDIYQSVTLKFTPKVMGPVSGSMTFTTTIGAVVVPLSAVAVPVLPVAILTGTIFSFLFAYQDGTNEQFVENVFDGVSGFFIFNASVWGSVTQEKTLERLYVIYENVGVCTLTLTAKILRPQQGPDFYDTVTDTITIGTALADGSLRSDFFDLQATGEIIELTVSRADNGGPCGICGFVPQFDVKGEKVEKT